MVYDNSVDISKMSKFLLHIFKKMLFDIKLIRELQMFGSTGKKLIRKIWIKKE
ncbi:hypothetical protein JOC94_002502 [Bacillus thermophilus]|uniref:Uncharacterized protein n=1 Tax=Siminovitchia thermophila TaxID=1245522 RepID=A0ABS2R7C5_9BACI|nr:hypothetical protein [Siminovitchia thermophila]